MSSTLPLSQLRDRIRRLEQGQPLDPDPASETALASGVPLGLPAIDRALPWSGLPRGMVHEILCRDPANAAATAFLLALVGQQSRYHAGPVLWVSCRRDLFAPVLPVYGCDPAAFLFVRCTNGDDVLWAMEDGLRCSALAAVAGDVGALDFPITRRLQLAANRGNVPLFLHRAQKGDALAPSAAVTRWEVASRPVDPAGAEGKTGDPAWTLHLRRCRGGRPGRWPVTWDRRRQTFTPAREKQNKEETSVAGAPQLASAA